MSFTWQNKSSFLFNGIDMYQTYGIMIADDGEPQDVLLPSLRPRKVTIPLRDGAYDFGAKYYNERDGVQITCVTTRVITRDETREIAYTLSKKAPIRFWTEPDKYYIGRVYQAPTLEQLRNIGNRFPLVFVCEPFAYGDTYTTAFDGLTLPVEYKGTAPTPTYIQITNNGTAAAVNIRISQIDRRENY